MAVGRSVGRYVARRSIRRSHKTSTTVAERREGGEAEAEEGVVDSVLRGGTATIMYTACDTS